MAAKFKIEQNPTFEAKVGIHRAGGEKIEVGMTFKYRTRTEAAELSEKWKQRGEDLAKEFEGKEADLPALVSAQIRLEVERILDVVEAWEFEDPVSEESVRLLLNGGKPIHDAITKAYFDGLDPARLGN
ncbi:phage tail assembly chaperone [Pseudomonas sp. SP16.1]|jgi:hypothetical protein|uniref:phage tail assembly chaperone n=1 Tax=Pseudomonas sp. SP16.1 TaxID=3458854 RepID=UPI00404548ED